ncbi:AraC family transcriptional regulator [Lachnospiraceae bacterium 54-53]
MNEITTQSIDQLLVSHIRTCQKAERTLHIHNNAYEIMLFKSGNVDYFINHVTYHLTPGSLTFICPNDIHGLFIKDDTPYERMPIHMEEGFAERLSTPDTDLFSCFHNPKQERLYHLSKEQMAEFELHVDTIITTLNEKSFGYDVRVKACLLFILLLANTAARSHDLSFGDISPKIIRDTISFVDENLSRDISIQMIADRLNISRSRLSHLFKEYTGTPLWNYIISRRIQYARTLLLNGASITNTCYECGFKDYAHFVKVFSRINGISPGKYVKNIPAYKKEASSSRLTL